jgi:hypothetical protein
LIWKVLDLLPAPKAWAQRGFIPPDRPNIREYLRVRKRVKKKVMRSWIGSGSESVGRLTTEGAGAEEGIHPARGRTSGSNCGFKRGLRKKLVVR